MSERLTSIGQIIDAVAVATAVSRLDILSERRTPAMVEARFTVWWLATKLTLQSYPQIGDATNRNHSSVHNGVRQAEAHRAADPDYRAATDALLATLHAAEKNAAIRLARPVDATAAARRILWNPTREAVRVSVAEIIAMAQLVVELTSPPEPSEPAIQEIDHAA